MSLWFPRRTFHNYKVMLWQMHKEQNASKSFLISKIFKNELPKSERKFFKRIRAVEWSIYVVFIQTSKFL